MEDKIAEALQDVDIVPWTAKDRVVQYAILIFVILNLIGVAVGLVWGL
jgi:hypothetical protein